MYRMWHRCFHKKDVHFHEMIAFVFSTAHSVTKMVDQKRDSTTKIISTPVLLKKILIYELLKILLHCNCVKINGARVDDTRMQSTPWVHNSKWNKFCRQMKKFTSTYFPMWNLRLCHLGHPVDMWNKFKKLQSRFSKEWLTRDPGFLGDFYSTLRVLYEATKKNFDLERDGQSIRQQGFSYQISTA